MKGWISQPFNDQKQVFDITCPLDQYDDYRSLAEVLREIGKNWSFQHEKGEETGYEHWQIRVSLHKRTRFDAFARDVMPKICGKWSLTSTPTTKGNQFDYVMKAQTRVAGPWTDKDADLRPPPVLTSQLKNFLDHELYPWQQRMLELAQEYNERQIVYCYDPHYNSGKSIFCEWLEYKGLAEEIPPFTLMEDIMQFVMCQTSSKCYLFDMPAAMKKDKVAQMYSGLEMLKNGFLYDKRYNGKKRRIDRPVVICFANNLPKLDLMAPDRWVTYYLTPEKALIPYDPNLHPFDTGPAIFGQFSD